MVTIVNFKKTANKEGEEFFALEIQGGVEMVRSKETGRFYATAKKTSMPSTFDEATCQAMIGQQISGRVVKVDCEPYEYTIKSTGEVITLSHRYEYSPEETQTASQVVPMAEVA